jgi:transposase-like protein
MDVLTKRVKHPDLPRMDHERIAQEYLSGRKTGVMLANEYGLHRNSISKIVSRYCQKNSGTFAETLITPIMPPKKVKQSSDTSALQYENERLRRDLKLAQLKIEGYQIMGDILEEEYGIDLLKKAGAGQSPVSKKDTQK